jgi:ribosomal protein L37E
VLSTLTHEMAHLWQAHCGTPSRGGYHNREWAQKMVELGLIPSDTGRPGGRQTGQRMTHFIEPGGAFDKAADELIAKGFVVAFVDRAVRSDGPTAVQKRLSKTHYRCQQCGQNAWAKPGASLDCGLCKSPFRPVAQCV